MLTTKVPDLHVSPIHQGFIHTKSHNYNYLLLRSLLLFEYSQRWSSVGYNDQDSIYFYARLHQETLKQYSLNNLLQNFSHYLYTLLIYNCKISIATVPRIAL